jgi:hypothetical protein
MFLSMLSRTPRQPVTTNETENTDGTNNTNSDTLAGIHPSYQAFFDRARALLLTWT